MKYHNEFLVLCLSTLGVIQGSDETSKTTTCSSDKFTCDDGNRCIPNRWVCDGSPDCLDKTDELEQNCPSDVMLKPKLCPIQKFRCMNGFCIPPSWKCDGQDDCGDGSDENETLCKIVCKKNEFKCGDDQCISSSYHCDGHLDCSDGTDESNCTFVVKLNDSEVPVVKLNDSVVVKLNDSVVVKPDDSKVTSFQCDRGSKIPISWKCDGDADCDSGEDEQDCKYEETTNKPKVNHNVCRTNEYLCPNAFCILNTWVCDGTEDCPGAQDEANCTIVHCNENTQFACKDKKHCIDKKLVCNGVTHCDDMSDELNCKQDVPTTVKPQVEVTSKKTVNVTTEPSFVEPTTASSCDLDTQFKCHSGKCILKSQVCDQQTNCPHREDESKELCGINECERNNGGCQDKCINTQEGHECQCSKGYVLSGKYACIDIDECKENPGICSQICKNTVGSFHCSCLEGYTREPSNYTRCKASQGEIYLLFSHSFDIRSLRLRDKDMTSVVQHTRRATALDYSYTEGKILWSDKKEKKIYRARLENTEDREVLVDGEDVSADGLAVDWVHNHIYYTDTEKSNIKLLSWDARHVKTIVSEEVGHPRAIVVSPHKGYIYWSDWGANAKIERASLNGDDREAIVNHPQVVWPNGLVIDHSTEKIYWCDGRLRTISSANLDGSNSQVILYSPFFLRQPFSISVFEDRLYWTDWSQVALFSANKFTGLDIQNVTAGHLLESPKVVHVYHEYRQPKSENVCDSHSCSHFCLRNPSGEALCDCADGYLLQQDQVSCVTEAIVLRREFVNRTIIEDIQLHSIEQKLIHSQNLHHESTSRIGFIVGSLVGILCGVAVVAGIYVAWTRAKPRQVPRIRFHNSVYRRTTADESDGRGYITDQDQLFSSHTSKLSQIDQQLTEADDAPLTSNEDYDGFAV